MTTAANIKNVRNMSGPGYFRRIGDARGRTFGHTESISWNTDIQTNDYFSSIDGPREKYDSDVSEITAGGEIVLRETDLANLVFQFAGEAADLVQDAAVDEVISGTGGKKGEMIDLGYRDVSSLVLTDLVEGVDYSLDAQAGIAELLADVGDYSGAVSAPAIAPGAEARVINILTRPEGITGEFRVVQKQKRGDRFMLVLPKVIIRPAGPISFSKEGTEESTISLSYECLADLSQPKEKRYGYVLKLSS